MSSSLENVSFFTMVINPENVCYIQMSSLLTRTEYTIQECQFCLAYHTKLFRHRFLKKWPKYLEMCLGNCKNGKNKYQWNLYCQLTKPLLFTVDFLKEKRKEKKAHINAHRFSLFTPVFFASGRWYYWENIISLSNSSYCYFSLSWVTHVTVQSWHHRLLLKTSNTLPLHFPSIHLYESHSNTNA